MITRRSKSAFTLVEVMLVIAVMAILAMAVALRTGSFLASTISHDVVKQLAFIDANARQSAINTGQPVNIIFDTRTISRPDSSGGGPVWPLPSTWHIDRVRTVNQNNSDLPVTIRISPSGLSQTYAVDISSSDGEQKTVLITGLSGQIVEGLDDQNMHTIFARLAGETDLSPGHDAH